MNFCNDFNVCPFGRSPFCILAAGIGLTASFVLQSLFLLKGFLSLGRFYLFFFFYYCWFLSLGRSEGTRNPHCFGFALSHRCLCSRAGVAQLYPSGISTGLRQGSRPWLWAGGQHGSTAWGWSLSRQAQEVRAGREPPCAACVGFPGYLRERAALHCLSPHCLCWRFRAPPRARHSTR